MKYFGIIGIITLTAMSVCAQDATPPPVPQLATGLDSVTAWLIAHMGTLLSGSAIVSEVLMRAIPTIKPMSWLYAASAILKSLDKFLQAFIQVLGGLQNTTPPAA